MAATTFDFGGQFTSKSITGDASALSDYNFATPVDWNVSLVGGESMSVMALDITHFSLTVGDQTISGQDGDAGVLISKIRSGQFNHSFGVILDSAFGGGSPWTAAYFMINISFTPIQKFAPLDAALYTADPDPLVRMGFVDANGAIRYAGHDIDTAAITGSAVMMGVPEPASWALMILGFGGVGAALRRRQIAPAT